MRERVREGDEGRGLGCGRARFRMLRWAAGGLGPNGPARMEPTWQVAAGLGRPSRALSLSLSKSLCKTEKNKENEKGKKRKVRERVGHGDNFLGLTKICSYQEK